MNSIIEFVISLIGIALSIVWILVGSKMGERRGRRHLGAILGFILGPIGLLILLAFPISQGKESAQKPRIQNKAGKYRTRCSICQVTLKASQEAEGKRFRCPRCGKKAVVELFQS